MELEFPGDDISSSTGIDAGESAEEMSNMVMSPTCLVADYAVSGLVLTVLLLIYITPVRDIHRYITFFIVVVFSFMAITHLYSRWLVYRFIGSEHVTIVWMTPAFALIIALCMMCIGPILEVMVVVFIVSMLVPSSLDTPIQVIVYVIPAIMDLIFQRTSYHKVVQFVIQTFLMSLCISIIAFTLADYLHNSDETNDIMYPCQQTHQQYPRTILEDDIFTYYILMSSILLSVIRFVYLWIVFVFESSNNCCQRFKNKTRCCASAPPTEDYNDV
jgi:hypothetical protein